MRFLAAVLTIATAAACASAQTTPSQSAPSAVPGPSTTPAPNGSLHSETAKGPYLLSIDLPKTTWAAGEKITGEATLALTQGESVDLGGSGGGLIGFSYAEVGGQMREMDGVMTTDCAPHLLTAQTPLTKELFPSGSWSEHDPNAAFYRAFATAPYVSLPEGTWNIRAFAEFTEGAGCSGTDYNFGTIVQVTITP